MIILASITLGALIIVFLTSKVLISVSKLVLALNSLGCHLSLK